MDFSNFVTGDQKFQKGKQSLVEKTVCLHCLVVLFKWLILVLLPAFNKYHGSQHVTPQMRKESLPHYRRPATIKDAHFFC